MMYLFPMLNVFLMIIFEPGMSSSKHCIPLSPFDL
ncbi:hypothetical protein SVI_1399 [Shewanella violacea DSS12]|uniref:Uncharacterized protein n=1 Tax=Shewanella violacea (strain JCM 10179 / CIP 106290 / LMG 19151 / DSS12) TaxID=637905 RepID=D4ZI71_SHEVD|nr:hypothetical protein SVI_1399 [Shewanella violacea DSS12]